jgi:hypothetical protein
MRRFLRKILWVGIALGAAAATFAADLRTPDAVRAGLHKLASEYGDMSRKVTGERYDRLAHDSEEFQEEAATLRKAIASEPADLRAEVESALASTLAASAHVADVSATHDKKQVEAALANLATVLEALNALFPESVRVEPGTVEPHRPKT